MALLKWKMLYFSLPHLYISPSKVGRMYSLSLGVKGLRVASVIVLMGSCNFKARLHMRFLMRFRVQNAPWPTLHECLFRQASRGLERKLSHIIWRQPTFQFVLTWRYFVAALRDWKTVRGRLGQVLYAKSHRNRMKNRMCKRAFMLLLAPACQGLHRGAASFSVIVLMGSCNCLLLSPPACAGLHRGAASFRQNSGGEAAVWSLQTASHQDPGRHRRSCGKAGEWPAPACYQRGTPNCIVAVTKKSFLNKRLIKVIPKLHSTNNTSWYFERWLFKGVLRGH